MGEKEEEMLLFYHNPLSHHSRKVVVALEEKKVLYQEQIVKMKMGMWFLELNPKREIPVRVPQLAKGAICDSETIMDYIDRKYGRANQLYPVEEEEAAKVRKMCCLVNSVNIFRLTCGVACFLTPSCTDMPRFSYNKYPTKRFKKFLGTMHHLEAVLDAIEAKLARDNKSGRWLFGPSFTAADIALSVLLAKLHQLGLDEQLWKGGIRPNVAIYQEMALERPSVKKATGFRANMGKNIVFPLSVLLARLHQLGLDETRFRANRGKKMPVRQGGAVGEGRSSDKSCAAAIGVAQVGLGVVLVVGVIYVCRKLLKK